MIASYYIAFCLAGSTYWQCGGLQRILAAQTLNWSSLPYSGLAIQNQIQFASQLVTWLQPMVPIQLAIIIRLAINTVKSLSGLQKESFIQHVQALYTQLSKSLSGLQKESFIYNRHFASYKNRILVLLYVELNKIFIWSDN